MMAELRLHAASPAWSWTPSWNRARKKALKGPTFPGLDPAQSIRKPAASISQGPMGEEEAEEWQVRVQGAPALALQKRAGLAQPRMDLSRGLCKVGGTWENSRHERERLGAWPRQLRPPRSLQTFLLRCTAEGTAGRTSFDPRWTSPLGARTPPALGPPPLSPARGTAHAFCSGALRAPGDPRLSKPSLSCWNGSGCVRDWGSGGRGCSLRSRTVP